MAVAVAVAVVVVVVVVVVAAVVVDIVMKEDYDGKHISTVVMVTMHANIISQQSRDMKNKRGRNNSGNPSGISARAFRTCGHCDTCQRSIR